MWRLRKDCGVVVGRPVNMSAQGTAVVKRAEMMLGIHRKGMENKTADQTTRLVQQDSSYALR